MTVNLPCRKCGADTGHSVEFEVQGKQGATFAEREGRSAIRWLLAAIVVLLVAGDIAFCQAGDASRLELRQCAWRAP